MLLLAGALSTAKSFEPVMAEPSLADAGVRVVAATLPGFGGTERPDDTSVGGYAALTAGLAESIGADVLGGHGRGGNVAAEAAAAHGFEGPVVLLSPALSREDAPRATRIADRAGMVLGTIPMRLASRINGYAPTAPTDPAFLRHNLRQFLRYLDGHGTVAARICQAHVRAHLAFGENDTIGLSESERILIDKCPGMTVETIEGAGHHTIRDRPDHVARLILKALGPRVPA